MRADDRPGLEASALQIDCADGAVLARGDDGAAEGCQRTLYSKTRKPQAARVGTWLWRNSTGQVVSRATYDEAGKLEGVAEVYGTDGQLIRRSNYVNNRLEGTEASYWPGGHIRELQVYHDGKLHGIRKRWTYSPPVELAGRCDESVEECWEGSQECWLNGERKAHDACARFYADIEKGRSIASIVER